MDHVVSQPVLPILLVMGILLGGCKTLRESNIFNITGNHSIDPVFIDTVKPVLEHRCMQCHHSGMPSGGLNFQNPDSLYSASPLGAFLVPGDPAQSRVWQALNHPQKHPQAMPKDGWGITVSDLEAFEAWISRGAKWPDTAVGKLEVKDYQVPIPDYL